MRFVQVNRDEYLNPDWIESGSITRWADDTYRVSYRLVSGRTVDGETFTSFEGALTALARICNLKEPW